MSQYASTVCSVACDTHSQFACFFPLHGAICFISELVFLQILSTKEKTDIFLVLRGNNYSGSAAVIIKWLQVLQPLCCCVLEQDKLRISTETILETIILEELRFKLGQGYTVINMQLDFANMNLPKLKNLNYNHLYIKKVVWFVTTWAWRALLSVPHR